MSLRSPGGLAANSQTDEAPQSRWHTFAIAAIICALGAAAFIVLTAFNLGGTTVTTAVDDVGNGVAAFIAAASCAFAATRFSGRTRLAWGLLAASTASWFAGEVYWSILEVGLGISPPTPSPADVGYLLAIPLAVAGVLAFPSAPMRLTTRSRAVVDGTIIALSLFAISWALGLGRCTASRRTICWPRSWGSPIRSATSWWAWCWSSRCAAPFHLSGAR